jgi:CspA family cold shock protein
MEIGVVKSFDRRLGSGMLTPENGGEDVRVHASEVERADLSNLEVGDRLSFDVSRSGAGGAPRATNLRLL